MIMSESEIIKEYKGAKKKNAQIQILAELNCVDPKEIKQILQKNGVYQQPGPKPKAHGTNVPEQDAVPPMPRKAATINEEFENAVQEMIEEGNKREEIEAADPVPGEQGYVQIIDGSDTKLPELPPKEPEHDKPPLGLMPKDIAEKLFNESRIRDIIEAMHRYYEADKTIPEAWRFELKERL